MGVIRTEDAIRIGRSLIGTPYSTLDCLFYIIRIIRCAPRGVRDYRTGTTVELWNSIEKDAKYKDLVWRQESIEGAKAGMLAFKRYSKDADHVGLVTGDGTVLHSSSRLHAVVETPLTAAEGWNGLGIHRYIQTATEAVEGEMSALYRARVITEQDPLSLRQVPETGRIIGKLPRGEIVDVMSAGDWPRVRYGDMMGYASAKYLERIDEDAQEDALHVRLVFTDVAGNTWTPVGNFSCELKVMND